MPQYSTNIDTQIINLISTFVDDKVLPIADKYDSEDIYPFELVDDMANLGLFGITIPEKYGGLGFSHSTLAKIFEELSKGWMSLAGVIGTHHILAEIVSNFGDEVQKKSFLPRLAKGDLRGGLALTESSSGTDVQNISTKAEKDGEEYVINGSKMFISNGQNGNAFAVLARTKPKSDEPLHRGLSCFIVEKPAHGLKVAQKLDKLGYRGIDTCELLFENVRVPAENLIGNIEGVGFKQVMSGLESGRINVAARAVGVATAAFNSAIKYAQKRETFGKPIAEHQGIQFMLADMATKIEAARLLTYEAAKKKDLGERVDLSAGMAKLFASEMCGEVAMDAMRIHGGYGYIKGLPIERFYREAPLMIIGEGTNEIQKLVIARRLLDNYNINL